VTIANALRIDGLRRLSVGRVVGTAIYAIR